MASTEDILGRTDVNDMEAILAITNTEVDEALHAVRSNYDTIFTWDYDKGQRPALNKLYEKANHWMVKYGFWCVAFFAFVPNPVFDAIGFAAGVLRYPLWKFVVACFLGKSLKFLLAAEAHLVIHWTCILFPRACDAFRSVSFGLVG